MSERVAYPVMVKTFSKKARQSSTGIYYAVTLPRNLTEKIGLRKGDKITLEIIEEDGITMKSGEIENKPITCVRGSPDVESRHQITVRGWDEDRPKPMIRLPIEWTDPDDEGHVDFPVEDGQSLTVELSTDNKELRIYFKQDYQYRRNKLTLEEEGELMIERPARSREKPEVYDLTDSHAGQLIRVIPIDGTYTGLLERAKSRNRSELLNDRILLKFFDQSEIESVGELTDPLYNEYNYISIEIEWDSSEGQLINYLNSDRIHSTSSKRRAIQYRLPSKGSFEFTIRATRVGNVECAGQTWLSYSESEIDPAEVLGRRVHDNWIGKYHLSPTDEDYIDLYVPLVPEDSPVRWEWSY